MTPKTIYIKKVITAQVDLNATDCIDCGVVFAMPDDLEQRRRQDGKTFYCPNGHTMVYGRGELERLRAEKEALQRELDLTYAVQRRLTDDLLDKAKEVKQLRQRVRAGLCSDCRRHFANLERHMKTKHAGGGKP